MENLDWKDIRDHALAGLAIGLVAGLLSHYELKGVSVGYVLIAFNTLGWFIREYFQKPNKDRLYKHLQVIIEYVVPALTGWIGFVLGKIIIERFFL